MLAQAVVAAAADSGHEVLAFDRASLDVTAEQQVSRTIGAARPDAIIHCAAYTQVDAAEREPAAAQLLNATATGYVAAAAAAVGAHLVYPSTDYVFDGSATVPYEPTSPTHPLNAYGATKLEGEAAAHSAGRFHIVRTSWLYGAGGRNFVSTMLSRAGTAAPLRVVSDQRGTPSWTRDVAGMLLRLLERGAPSGIYHATNAGDTTWFEFAGAIFDLAGLHPDLQPIASTSANGAARRPRYSVLDCGSTYSIVGSAPHWRDALKSAMAELA
jgi:dTDP-4-dehydrorhamnose reductase